jgi:cytochrome c oxidase subunit 3/cytochrome o ubiquinol oxidase subunit 3
VSIHLETEAAPAPAAATGHGHGHALEPAKVGMAAFLVTEVAFFGTLVMAYVAYIGRDAAQGLPGPRPSEVFSMPLVLLSSAFLLSSSVTIHLASNAFYRKDLAGFRQYWAVTILLGALFLVGTAWEWRELMHHGLTPWRNLFGTTYYTLVGFHALHVTIGLILLTLVLVLSLRSGTPQTKPLDQELVSWYWHFVDGVWVVVFTVVYLISR